MPPFRADILTSIAGVSYSTAAQNAGEFDLEGRRILVIGREALIANKRASGRPQDLADVAALEAAGPEAR